MLPRLRIQGLHPTTAPTATAAGETTAFMYNCTAYPFNTMPAGKALLRPTNTAPACSKLSVRLAVVHRGAHCVRCFVSVKRSKAAWFRCAKWLVDANLCGCTSAAALSMTRTKQMVAQQ